jgi:MFS family permease
VLTFSQFAPILFLAPWTGSAADRFDRRRLLLVTQPLAAALSGALALVTALDLATAALVICFGLAQGVVTAFSTPAQQALFVSLVTRQEVPTAVALNSMTFNIARAVGPATAAAVIVTLGIAAAFTLNAVSYLLFVGALLLVRPRRQERPGSAKLRDSLELLRREPRLLYALAIVMTVGFASDPINTLAPAFADAFGKPDTFSGYIIGVFGAGAVTAAFVLAGHAPERTRIIATLFLLVGGVCAFSIAPGSLSPCRFSSLRASAISARTPARRASSSSAWPRRSAAASWRSGASRFSACGRWRASSTVRSPLRSACASRGLSSPSPL